MGQGDMEQRQGEMAVLTELRKTKDVNIDPREEAAYKVFYSLKPEEVEKKIQLGNDFLQRYPKSLLAEAVDAGLMNAYYGKQDWKNVYASADSALGLKPDDVDVLTTVGWLIPHVSKSSDPDADKQLDKAEGYEKHALEVMGTMPKPSYLTDAQFAASKAQKSVQAHSGLGLVYFRRGNFEESAKELQQAVQGNASPDQTDLFVLGVDLQNLYRFSEAVDAFERCVQAPGGLQDNCKQSAADAKKQVR